MPEPIPLTEEEREIIKPHLLASLDPDSASFVDELLEQDVVHTYPDGTHLITINIPNFPAMQFYATTGEFAELTEWEYIQTVDAEAQQQEAEQKEYVENITTVLKHYHKQEYQISTDYEKVIENREEIIVNGETVYVYSCPGQVIYLDETNYPITYNNQKVYGEWYYYNFTELTIDPTLDEIDKYDYKVSYEWKRCNDIWK